jgi:glyoxylate/hydroxypyruvate reductase A
LRQLPNLVWVHSVWAGVERLLSDLNDTGLHIVRLVDPQLATTMAEAVLAWTLYLHRDMPAYARQQRERHWKANEYQRPQSKTVGLLGLGALGEAAARPLLAAGFQVCGWSRTLKQLHGVECYAGEDGLHAMLAKTNILVCLLPLTEATTSLLNTDRLQLLPPGAALINFARGLIVVDADLRQALDGGHIDHAVLDVFSTEPLPSDSWHWEHPGVTVLPHCSAPTDKHTASKIVAQNITRYTKQGLLPEGVNRQTGY